MKKKILVTGGAGFIGSEFVRQFAAKYNIIVVDKITYAGDLKRIEEVKSKINFYKNDITNLEALSKIFQASKPDIVIHFAAETHVDRSILDPKPFIKTNLIGTQNLIELALKHKIKKFVHISTDEVYGDHKTGRFKEHENLNPGNPYAATKAAAELQIKAAIKTYGLPAIIIRPANNYGHWQYPEKFVPVILIKALNNQPVPVYGKGKQIREWLHVSDCAKAIDCVLNKGKTAEAYNIGSYIEQENIVTAKTILKYINKPESLIKFVKDRPGHDFRYSVDCSKLRKLGWKPTMSFAKGMQSTIAWYNEHQPWLKQKRQTLETYWKKVYK